MAVLGNLVPEKILEYTAKNIFKVLAKLVNNEV
jgi:hypothetical protein